MSGTGPRDPWQKMRSETNDAYRAFRIWLEMPPERRNHLEAYRIYSGKPDAISSSSGWFHWRNKFNWDDRAESYDDMMDRERIKAQLQGVRKAAKERGEKLVNQYEEFERLTPKLIDVIEMMIHEFESGNASWNMAAMNGAIGRLTDMFKLRMQIERTTEKVDEEEETSTELERALKEIIEGEDAKAAEGDSARTGDSSSH